MDRISEDELAKGMLPPVVLTTVVSDVTTENILLKGGDHPKMRFVDDANFARSYSAAVAFNTTDPVITLKKGAGRIAVAVTAGGLAAAGGVERFTRTAAAAGKQEDQVCVFEVEDDVVIVGDGAGGAGGLNLVQLTFERIE